MERHKLLFVETGDAEETSLALAAYHKVSIINFMVIFAFPLSELTEKALFTLRFLYIGSEMF